MSPVIFRMTWGSSDDMTLALRSRIATLPEAGTGLKWEAVSISALSDEVVVLVVLKAKP